MLKFHKKHKKIVTVTAVRPNARFGELKIQDENLLYSFCKLYLFTIEPDEKFLTTNSIGIISTF